MKIENIETHEQAVSRRKAIIRALSSGDEAAAAVAVQLRNCRKGRRCKTAACSVCHQNHRKNWIEETDALMQGKEFTRASLIVAKMRVPEGKLVDVDLLKLLDLVRKGLGRKFPGIRLLGGFDILFQVRKGRKGFWQIHLYLLFERLATSYATTRPQFRRGRLHLLALLASLVKLPRQRNFHEIN